MAETVCARLSAWPTTRMSSSSAKILRSPARNMACVSATITRIVPLPSPGCMPSPVSPFAGLFIAVLIGVLIEVLLIHPLFAPYPTRPASRALLAQPFTSHFTTCAQNDIRQSPRRLHAAHHRSEERRVGKEC